MGRDDSSAMLLEHAQSNDVQSIDTQSNNASISEEPREITLPTLTQPMMMEHARSQATFDSGKLTEIILGGRVVNAS